MTARGVLLLALLLVSACTPSMPVVTAQAVEPSPTPTASRPAAVPSATSASSGTTGPSTTGQEVPTAAAASAATATPAGIVITGPATAELAFPVRAAFYYPWFPQSWNQGGINPFTHYHPSLGFYNQDDPAVIQQQIAAMQYGKIQAGISSWWGVGHYTDQRVPALLKAGESAGFKWALYIESEGQGDPTAAAIQADLTYIRDHYATSPAYWTVGGRFVVFVYADPNDTCGMADRWKQANTVGAYVVLKVFANFRGCASQPDHWHQYAPANAQDQQDVNGVANSFTISPGFWLATDAQPRLVRDLNRWQSSIKAMIASKADLQLVTTFNEWGEGTSVESADEWKSPSGYGYYLDALHYDGVIPTGPLSEKDYLPSVMKDDPYIMVGAGDIADCKLSGVAATSRQLDAFPGAMIFTVGDTTYEDGLPAEFSDCFGPTWGRYKNRIQPAAGNHEYKTASAAGYFGYFGAAAGDPSLGYYSYDQGGWHVIVLNSNCNEVACAAGSPQEQWLKADLAAHPARCTLAYWHHPRFSSGEHGSHEEVAAFWDDLYAAGVELVINGHDHLYERFAPQNPAGSLDPQQGIRQIIVGTGGANLTGVANRQPNSEVVITQTYGILQLTLHGSAYNWAFLPASGDQPADAGSQACH